MELEIFVGKTFENVTMTLSGKQFVRCTLKNCTLIYGGAPCRMKLCTYIDCTWEFIATASSTLTLLADIGLPIPGKLIRR